MSASRVYTVEGIILKRRNIGETDRMLILFTKQKGKLQVTGKGVRRVSSRRGPHLEIFTRVILTVHKNTVTEASTVDNYEKIRKSLDRIGAAYYLCELIDGLLPAEQVHEDVFKLLCEAFETLASVKKEHVEILRERFVAALLRTLGYLERGKKPPTGSLNSYVEQLLERRLKTVRLVSHFRI